MKTVHGFFFFCLISFLMVSCGADGQDPDTPKVNTPDPEKRETGSTIKFENKGEIPGGVVVESTEERPEAAIDDADVDYRKLAAAVCKCGAGAVETGEAKQGDVHVTADDTDYQKEVDCSVKAKNAIAKGQISRQKLVVAIKDACHDIPGKFVMRLMMSLE